MSYAYDAARRLYQITNSLGPAHAAGDKLVYTLDLMGNRTKEEVFAADNNVVQRKNRVFDSLSRLATELNAANTVIAAYTYDGPRPVASLGLPRNNGNLKTQTQKYDAVTTNEVLLGYDAVGRRQTLTLPNGIVATHSYDDASQLVGIQYSRGSSTLGDLTYAYDAAGQRIEMGGSFARMTLPQPLNNAAYNAANRLTNWEGVVQTYDLNGNLTNDGSHTYTWDTRNRLSGITGGATAAFKYDGTNRRYEKTVAGVSTGFLYDGLNPAHELTGTTTAVKASLMTGSGLDQFFARIDTAGTSSMITDGLGSTIALAGANGAVATQYTYEPYGKTTQIGAASENAFQYTGRENDVTGLYYYRARYYDPAKSRFLSEDPIGLAGGINTYGYVGGNPVQFSDPSGLFTSDIHAALTNNSFSGSGFSSSFVSDVIAASVLADVGTQGVSDAHKHAMSQPGESGYAAYTKWNNYMRGQIGRCNAKGLGNALHAMEDSAARGHANFQTYDGSTSFGHLWGDFTPSYSEWQNAQALSGEVIDQFRRQCGCK